jgi:vacuolar-type H+-ATPase subunit H
MDNDTALAIITEKVQALVVVDQNSLTVAHDLLLSIKSLRCRFDEEFDKGITEAYAHHKTLVAQKKKWTAPLDEYERLIKPRITAYLVEQDNIRLEAERAAERTRLAVEKEAEDAADVATELIKEGKAGEAEEIIDMAHEKIRDIQADTPFVPEKPAAPGVSLRETWDFEITDTALIPRTFLIPDLTMIRRYGQNMKHQANIPGIQFFAVKSIATRNGRY